MKQKHLGLGTSDTTKAEWYTQINRDKYASLLLHTGLLEYTVLSGPHRTKAEARLDVLNKMCKDHRG